MYLDPVFIKKVPPNLDGRDFVVGDLHGCFDELSKLLNYVKFDTSRDRLFSTGDLIDRGPKSLECLNLLNEKWFFAVLGNHEDLILNNISNPEYRNGEMTYEERLVLDPQYNFQKKIYELPLMYEIEHIIHGLVYIVHAEILPEHILFNEEGLYQRDFDRYFHSMKSYDFSNAIGNFIDKYRYSTLDYDLKQKLIWSRKFATNFYKEHQDRIENSDFSFIYQDSFAQKNKIFCGHNVVPFPIKIGQQYYLDTGCALGYSTKELNSYLFTQFGHQYFALSMVDITTGSCYGCISTSSNRGQVLKLEKPIYSL